MAEWRSTVAGKDFETLSDMELLHLVKMLVVTVDEGHPEITSLEEAIEVARIQSRIICAMAVLVGRQASRLAGLKGDSST